MPGVEVVSSVEDALRPLVREALRAHATMCVEAWSDEREHRFVEGRARLPDGDELPVERAIDKALEAHRCALLLGDFGTGKSTQMARRAARMARAYLADERQFPAPVLLPLTGRKPELGAIVTHHMKESLPVEALRLSVDLGMVVPIFDGLDELAQESGPPDGAIAALVGAFADRARVILTSRRMLFPTAERMREALGGVTGLAVVELQGLDSAEVAAFVERAMPSAEEAERTLESIQHMHDLENLAQRPALLELIVNSRDKLSREEITASALYRMATEDWLGSRRDQERDVSRAQRLAFARSLARTLFHSSAESVTYAEVARGVLELLGDRFVSLDRPLLEVRLAVFLAFEEASDRFRFAHRSFLEYFLAVDIAERLDADRHDALDLPRLTPEIVAFLAGVEGWEGRRAKLQSMLVDPCRARTSENALLALYHAAGAKVGEGEALGAMLDKEIPEGAMLAGAQLSGVRLPWISLPGADLVGAHLSQADLCFADLRGARLDRAKADHAVFDGALLDGARLLEADVFATSFVDASLAGVRWDGSSRQGMTLLDGASAVGESGGTTSPPAPSYQAQEALTDHVAWSPDGRWLACTAGESIQIRDALTGEVRALLSGNLGLVRSVAFSPDGCALASGSNDRRVRLWDAQTGTLRQILAGHQAWVNSVAFSPDGRVLASASKDQTVRLWDAQTGALRQILAGHQGGVNSVAFSPDGRVLASASEDLMVRLWNAQTGALRQTLAGHQGWVNCVAFSPDGRVLASASEDQTVHLWDAQTGALRQTLAGHQGGVNSVVFSPDGCALASGSDDQTVRLWDAQIGARQQILSSHQGGVNSVAFSPDGRVLASASEDQTVRLWNAQTGALRQTLAGHQGWVLSVAFLPDGRVLASTSENLTVRLWDAQTGALRQTLAGRQGGVSCMAFSSDGHALASASEDQTVHLWDAQTGALRQTLAGHQGGVNSVAFSPDGRTLASASRDLTVRLWDTQTGALRQTLAGHQGRVNCVAFSPDGRTLASGSYDQTVRLWDAQTGALRQTLAGHQGWVLSVAFSPDGRALASASDDKTVRLWNTQTGALQRTLSGHQGWILSVVFSPDGCALASASNDRTVRLWDAQTGALWQTFSGHQNRISSVAFSPDSRALASGSYDQTVRLWDATSGQCLAILHATEAGFVALAAGTPFFFAEGDLSQLLRFVSGERIMPAELWAPLFHRPDLVRDAIAGNPPDLAALDLDTYAACERALIAERERRGLVRRRVPTRLTDTAPATEPSPRALEHVLSLPLETLTLAPRADGKRPPVVVPVDAVRLPAGAEITAALHRGTEITPARVTRSPRLDRPDAAILQVEADISAPGTGILTVTVTSPEGISRTDTLSVSFVPENPYIAGPPIHDAKDFYGREGEITRIVRDLDKESISIIGPMRIGKTSLLHQVQHRFPGASVFVSLQRYAGRFDTLLPELTELITPGQAYSGDAYARIDLAVSARLAAVTRAGRRPRFLIILDEAQFLVEATTTRHQLRGLLQSRHGDGLRALVAGPPAAMRHLSHDAASSPFLNMFQPVRLGPMDLAEVTRLVRAPLGEEMTFTDDAVAEVFASSGGQPLIAQALCREALEAVRAGGRYRIEAEDIGRALEEKVLESVVHDIFGYPARWRALPEPVREVLLALANKTPGERATVNRDTLRLLAEHDLADVRKKRLEIEPTFFLWLKEEGG